MLFFLACALVLLAVLIGILWKLAELIWYIAWGLVIIIAGVLSLIALAVERLTGAFIRSVNDRWTVQAREDQRRAQHPGCHLGLMSCGSQTCACIGDRPCRAFVLARAAFLRREHASRAGAAL